MAIHFKCPKCLTEFKVKDSMAGRTVSCSECSQRFVVPELEEPEEDDGFVEIPYQPPADPVPTQTDAGGDEGWSTPDWGADAPPQPESPDMPFPEAEAPSLPGASAPSGPDIGFGTVADFAMDPGLITFALQWAGVWMLLAVLTGLLVFTGQMILVLVAGLLFAAGTWVVMAGMTGGLSFLVSRKLGTGETPPTSSAWRLFGQCWIALVLGTLGIAMACVLVAGLVDVLVYALTLIPYVGLVLGASLLIPVFLFNLFVVSLFGNLYLLPIIIGVDVTTATQAFHILRRLVVKNGFRLYGSLARGVGQTFLFWLMTLAIIGPALAAAFLACGGFKSIFYTLPRILMLLSGSAIAAVWMALITVFGNAALTLVYCECTGRAYVDD